MHQQQEPGILWDTNLTEKGYQMTDKEKLKEILKWCKINAKGWDPDQHDGPAEFKAICDLIEEKGYYKNEYKRS